MYLTLPIPSKNRNEQKNGPVSIEECLEQFLEEETLKGDDAWHCPRCKQPRTASKKLSIVKLPTVLLVHLKRFSFEGPFRNKLETKVLFPLKSVQD
jgi:ubiquitin carboxyl-terminal hydrolase 8